MTYTEVRKQMLQGSPEDQVYQLVRDMIDLCESIDMKPEDCAYFVRDQLRKANLELQVMERSEEVVYQPKTKLTGSIIDGGFYINCKESLLMNN